MSNSWPAASGTTTGYKAQGVTTIRWGTDGILQNPKPGYTNQAFLVVIRANQRPLVDNIKLMNGTGPTVTRVQINDGSVWDLTVRDDTYIDGTLGTWPTPGKTPNVGQAVYVTDMAGMISPSGIPPGVPGNAYVATVVESGYEAAPKQAGERTITVENLLLIESQTAQSTT